MSRAEILAELDAERERQIAKHGDQAHLPNGTGGDIAREMAAAFQAITDARAQAGGDGSITFLDILAEEFFEAAAEESDGPLRVELRQVAAVIVQWIEAIDRRNAEGRAA